MAQYGVKDYWEERYKNDKDLFDWFQRWAGLKATMETFLEPSHKILMLGCGSSRLSEDLFEDGYTNITNMDYSTEAIKQMKFRYADTNKSPMTWEVMDALQMSYENESFDIVIDKGTFDSILCGENSNKNAPRMLAEVSRVLRQDGIYFCISYGQPQYRTTYLENEEYGWTVDIKKVSKPSIDSNIGSHEKDSVHYIYICTKVKTAEEHSPAVGEKSVDD